MTFPDPFFTTLLISRHRKQNKITNTNEFALSIQAERKNALGKEFLAKNQPILLFEKCSKLFIMQETALPHLASNLSTASVESIIEVSSTPCILSSGSRVMLKERVLQNTTEIESKVSTSSSSSHRRYMKQLLARPIEDIIREHDELVIQKMLAAPSAVSRSSDLGSGRAFASAIDDDDEDNPFDRDNRDDLEKQPQQAQLLPHSSDDMADNNLWVNKYAPKTFTQVWLTCF